ncbi:YihY/virulence factor BrkB family protein [Nigerium massiliense]|uniref:YihY/virulence factor BrkB family protein n=1 Tax=Nigerium massiliense TaxID=1522317 RepID=UPI0009079630|nr:YihY/virulence factor BrkB family protein [Nigerium massiliense]
MADTKNAPAPEDPAKPDSPAKLKGGDWKYVLRTTMREFGDDGLSDLAAGLTYYTVLSIFPGLIALVSILSLFGQNADAVNSLLGEVGRIVPQDTMATIMPVLQNLLTAPAPGLGLVLGILTALWSASNYVKAFGRALNRIYEVPEGRGPIKLNLTQYLLTAAILVLVAVALVLITASGPILDTIGQLFGLGSLFLTVFSIIKWPILLIVAILIVAMLYYFTPNVRQPKFRWISPGAVIGLVMAAVAGGAFALYAGNFGSYDATYGALAGVIIFLFLLNIINLALLFGAEFDAEMERARELRGGIKAEEDIQLPQRDTAASDKKEKKAEKDYADGRRMRLEATHGNDVVGAHEDTVQTHRAGTDQSPSKGSHKVSSAQLKELDKKEKEAEKRRREAAKSSTHPRDHFGYDVDAPDPKDLPPRRPVDHYPDKD